MAVIGHFISGSVVDGTSGRSAAVFDPALGIETKRLALADASEVDKAVAAAKLAFPAWRDT